MLAIISHLKYIPDEIIPAVLSFPASSLLDAKTIGRPLVLIFLAIAIGSFILIAGSFLFGHDHDTDHGDVGHGGDAHDIGHDMEPTISFFSLKVIATLTMGFGAAGAIARLYGANYLIASLIGLGVGVVLSLLMYFLLDIIYKQQSSSLVQTSSAIGQTGIVQTGITPDGRGEVSLNVSGQYMTYVAKSVASKSIPKGRTVRVVSVVGSELVVEEVS
jgi:membrane protein implicated in regulation of membrane protease activity